MINKKLLFSLFIFSFSLPILLVLYFLFLKDPSIWPDEAIFFEMSRNLLMRGKLVSYMFGGVIPYVEQIGLGYPPLYFYFLGLWTNIFGQSIEAVRASSLFISFLSLGTFFLIVRELFKSKWLSALGVILLFSDVHFSRASRIARMDMLTFFLFLLSLLLLIHARKRDKNYLYIIVGLLAAMASLAHTIGFISTAIILTFILLNNTTVKNKLIQLLTVSVPVLAANLLWAIFSNDSLTSLLQAYKIHLQAKTSKAAYIVTLINSDFLWVLIFFTYLIFLIFLLITIIKYKKRESLLMFLGLLISSTLLLMGKEGWYIIYFQPFITLIVLFLFKTYKDNKNKFYITGISMAFLVLYLSNVSMLFFNNKNSFAKVENTIPIFDYNKYDYHYFTKRIKEALPENEKVSVSLVSIPDPYFDLKENKNLTLYQIILGYTTSDKAYQQLLDKSDYLVFTWVPYPVLVSYIENNTESYNVVGQQDGYSATIVKFVPRDKRK